MGTFINKDQNLLSIIKYNSELNISFFYLCFGSKNKMEIQKVRNLLITGICCIKVGYIWFTDINEKYEILYKISILI